MESEGISVAHFDFSALEEALEVVAEALSSSRRGASPMNLQCIVLAWLTLAGLGGFSLGMELRRSFTVGVTTEKGVWSKESLRLLSSDYAKCYCVTRTRSEDRVRGGRSEEGENGHAKTVYPLDIVQLRSYKYIISVCRNILIQLAAISLVTHVNEPYFYFYYYSQFPDARLLFI